MNPGTIGWSQNPEQHLNQMNTTNSALSARSTAVTNQGTNWETASSSQFPAVSFDLGNEWDNWGDFDDENLVHASETSFASGTTDAKPQIQQSIACNTPGRVKSKFHLIQEIEVEDQVDSQFVIHLIKMSSEHICTHVLIIFV